MKIGILTLLALLCSYCLAAQTALGTWQTIDDKSGKVRSHIKIEERGNKLYGKVVKTLNPDAPTHCATCSGARKDQPYIGMEIITAAVPDGDKTWEGQIYDPEGDSTYKLVMWLEENPDVLYVRGKHWTGLYRTQTWQRLGR